MPRFIVFNCQTRIKINSIFKKNKRSNILIIIVDRENVPLEIFPSTKRIFLVFVTIRGRKKNFTVLFFFSSFLLPRSLCSFIAPISNTERTLTQTSRMRVQRGGINRHVVSLRTRIRAPLNYYVLSLSLSLPFSLYPTIPVVPASPHFYLVLYHALLHVSRQVTCKF